MNNNYNHATDLYTVSDPVSVHDGRLVGLSTDFIWFGNLTLSFDRNLFFKENLITPLGRNYFSDIDRIIFESSNDIDELIYIDATGRSIHFKRPIPAPGIWEKNQAYKNLELAAGNNRQLILRQEKIYTTFQKYEDNIWRIKTIKHISGSQIDFYRDKKSGVLNQLHRSDGMKAIFENNDKGLRISLSIIGINGEYCRILNYSYDDFNNLITVDNLYGSVRHMSYDASGNLSEWKEDSSTGKHYYDEKNRVVHTTTNGAYNNDSFQHDSIKKIMSFIPNGDKEKTIEFHYDAIGRIESKKGPLGKKTSYSYDRYGYKVAETNANGETFKYKYDDYGHIESVTDPEEREIAIFRDIDGSPEVIVDAKGDKWHYFYDQLGNLIKFINPLGVITEFKNNDRGQPVAIMRHDGLMEQRQYDDYGRLIVVSDFKGTKTHIFYDGFGRVVSVTDGKGAVTKLKYEHQKGADFWSPSAIKRPDGVVISKTYDQKQQIVKTVDGEGRQTAYIYGPFQLLESIEDAKGGKLHFQYDGQERLLNVTNQLGKKWLFERDAAGRVIKEIDFAGLIQNYSYDKADRIIATQYADGAKLNFAYDKSGLLLKEQAFASDGSLQDETTYHYDQTGLLSRAENNSAVVAFKRDALGRVISETLNGREITSRFDCCGNRTAREIGGKLVEATYDPLGALQSLTINKHQPLQMTLDPLGRELKRESAAGFVLNQSYDVLGQLKSQIGGFAIASLGRGLEGAMAAQKQGIDPSKATSQVERHFNWNKSFEPLAIDDKRWGNTSYNYDANGQIVESSSNDGTVERFRYDSALNINGFSGGNAADTAKFEQWLSRQGGAISEAKGPNGERVHLTYDSRNRVIERRVEKNGFRIKIWKYQWDAKDRLIGCTTPTGERWTYHYDPFGRRIFKINASIAQKALLAQSPNVTELEKNRGAYHEDNHQRGSGDMSEETIVGTAYLWDANTIAEEAPLKASGEADWDKATKWHYEPDTFRPIAKETENGELFYIVNDHLGTPREMFSEDGKLVWAAQYRTWGAVHKIWQADNDNDIRGPYPPPIRGNLAFKYDTVEAEAAQICPIRFQGQWEDAETGLYYNRFRYYDPLAAQYISPDPIGLAGGMRSNAYVHNPNTWIDPWGLSRTPCCYPKDWFDNKTINKSGWYNNERDARNHARQMLGKNPVRIEQGKWRSQDGRWQYRAKEGDLMGHSPTDTRHVHIERLDPDTGYVITNYHLRW